MFRKFGMVAACAAVMLFSGTMVKAETPANRQEQEKAAEQKLNDLDKKMDDLSSESKKTGGGAQAEINRLYEEFKKSQEHASKDLEQLRKSTNESWDKAKTHLDKAIENLNGLYERSRAKSKGTGTDTTK